MKNKKDWFGCNPESEASAVDNIITIAASTAAGLLAGVVFSVFLSYMRNSDREIGLVPNTLFMRPVKPDDLLAAIVGEEDMPRTEITKRLWMYIIDNGLQDENNKRRINTDEKLKALCGGKESVGLFELTGIIQKHIF